MNCAIRLFVALVACVAAVLPARGGVVELDTVRSWGLPVLVIETVNHEEPRCEYVGPPEGCIGATTRNATKVPARLQLFSADIADPEPLYDSGDYVPDTAGLTVNIRGNTSAFIDKKPYKLKLQRKADLLLRGDSECKDKNWLLLHDDDLKSLFGLTVSQVVGMKWTPAFTYVNVVFNGDYRGIYLLIEQVRRNRDCRLNCEKTGFVVELDPYWWNEELSIKSLAFSATYRYTFKYPEWDDVTDAQLAYVTQVMNKFDKSIAKGTYPQYIDVASMARWLVAHEIMGTWDSGGANKYFLKYDNSDTTLLEMPVLWDFDSSMQMEGAWSRLHSDIFRRFFSNSNMELVKQWQHRWRTLTPWVADTIKARYKRWVKSEQGRGVEASRPHDNARWGTAHPTVADCRKQVNAWVKARKLWLDEHVDDFYADPCAPADVNEDGRVDVDDLNLVINIMMRRKQPFYRADVNCDAVVDIDDVNAVVNAIMSK